MQMRKNYEKKTYTNQLFHKVILLYAFILLVMGCITLGIAYSKEYEGMLSQQELAMHDLNYNYKSRTDDFWKIYMPIFENRDSVYSSLKKYYVTGTVDDLTPVERNDLVQALKSVLSGDTEIEWIGIYSEISMQAILLYQGDNYLTKMTEDFPFAEEIKTKERGMEIYGAKAITRENGVYYSFAVSGDTARDMADGKLIIGYSAEKLASSYVKSEEVDYIRFLITNENGVVFDSANEYTNCEEFHNVTAGFVQNSEEQLIYVNVFQTGSREYELFCMFPARELIFGHWSYATLIVLIILFFVAASLAVYQMTKRVLVGKIKNIQFALERIGENDLEYRIELPEKRKDEFEEIAYSINEVAARLKENIDKEYIARMKRKEAELSELQAKFDPHFLYNSLEVIRGRVYENGDEETANVLVKLTQIFRSFIGTEYFVSIREEIDFCNLYLSLLEYRYDNQVEVIRDIDSEVFRYGIIRNLIQPIIENYFVHGFLGENDDNQLIIRAKIQEEQYIRIQIQDNGFGVTPERLKEINAGLEENASKDGKSSYGMKNIHKRIKLFYGPECGIKIMSNPEGGVTVELKILMLTCKEHEERMAITNFE